MIYNGDSAFFVYGKKNHFELTQLLHHPPVAIGGWWWPSPSGQSMVFNLQYTFSPLPANVGTNCGDPTKCHFVGIPHIFPTLAGKVLLSIWPLSIRGCPKITNVSSWWHNFFFSLFTILIIMHEWWHTLVHMFTTHFGGVQNGCPHDFKLAVGRILTKETAIMETWLMHATRAGDIKTEENKSNSCLSPLISLITNKLILFIVFTSNHLPFPWRMNLNHAFTEHVRQVLKQLLANSSEHWPCNCSREIVVICSLPMKIAHCKVRDFPFCYLIDLLYWLGLGRLDITWLGIPWHVLAWHSMSWHGIACLGLAWLGLAWLGLDWHGLAWLGLAWPGVAWPGLAWLGLAWLGLAWLGLAWLGLGLAWLGLAWLRLSSLGLVRLG